MKAIVILITNYLKRPVCPHNVTVAALIKGKSKLICVNCGKEF